MRRRSVIKAEAGPHYDRQNCRTQRGQTAAVTDRRPLQRYGSRGTTGPPRSPRLGGCCAHAHQPLLMAVQDKGVSDAADLMATYASRTSTRHAAERRFIIGSRPATITPARRALRSIPVAPPVNPRQKAVLLGSTTRAAMASSGSDAQRRSSMERPCIGPTQQASPSRHRPAQVIRTINRRDVHAVVERQESAATRAAEGIQNSGLSMLS